MKTSNKFHKNWIKCAPKICNSPSNPTTSNKKPAITKRKQRSKSTTKSSRCTKVIPSKHLSLPKPQTTPPKSTSIRQRTDCARNKFRFFIGMSLVLSHKPSLATPPYQPNHAFLFFFSKSRQVSSDPRAEIISKLFFRTNLGSLASKSVFNSPRHFVRKPVFLSLLCFTFFSGLFLCVCWCA